MMFLIDTPLYEGHVNTDAIDTIEVRKWNGEYVLGMTVLGDFRKILTGSEERCLACARTLASAINKGGTRWSSGGEA